MATIGFNFTKMLVERKPATGTKISVANNISVVNVDQQKLAVAGGSNVLAVGFRFELKYNDAYTCLNYKNDNLNLNKNRHKQQHIKSVSIIYFL